jgi:hypothetical protein
MPIASKGRTPSGGLPIGKRKGALGGMANHAARKPLSHRPGERGKFEDPESPNLGPGVAPNDIKAMCNVDAVNMACNTINRHAAYHPGDGL